MTDIELPDEWEWILPDDAERFEAELREEMVELHPVFNISTVCLARRSMRDDFLFMLGPYSGDHGLAVVHLTWTGESTPEFPWTTLFYDFQDFLRDWRRIPD